MTSDCVSAMGADRPEERKNPFPGLRPFTIDEAHLFFGRSHQIDEVLATLDRRRFVAVVGPSGSGKSSLVRAGLLPALEGGFSSRVGSQWLIANFRPGISPIHNLARALATPGVLGEAGTRDDLMIAQIEAGLRHSRLGLADVVRHSPLLAMGRLLVVVDQFEELFRFDEHGGELRRDEVARFIQLLLTAVGDELAPVDVVVTMRSDYLGDCAQFRDLPEAINSGLYLVPRMTRDQLGEAITGPVAVYRGRITRRLVQRILNDAGPDPDVLPLVQHALMRTWDAWHGEADPESLGMDLIHYQGVGGLQRALSEHADEAFGELDLAEQRHIAESVFKQLTAVSRDGKEMRRPQKLDTLAVVAGASPNEMIEVIEHFARPGRTFVFCFPDGTVDISHESLIRQWNRLGTWAAEEAEFGRNYTELAEDAEKRARGERGLMGPRELLNARKWWSAAKPTEAWAARYHSGFKAASSYLRQSERQAWAQAALVVGAVSVIVVLAVAFWVAKQSAENQERLAVSRQLAAQAVADLGSTPHEPLLLSLSAYQLAPTAEAEGALLSSLAANPNVARYIADHDTRVVSTAFSPDGTILASGGEDGTIRLHDAHSGEELRASPLRLHEEAVYGLAFAPGTDRLASSDDAGAIRLWNTSTGEAVGEALDAHSARARALAFHPSEPGLLASGSEDGTIRLWRLDESPPRLVTELDGHRRGGAPREVRSVAFSPDGTVLASGGNDWLVRLWNASTGEPLGEPLEGHGDEVRSLAFSPVARERLLASGSNDKTILLWSVDESGGARARGLAGGDLPPLTGHEQRIYSIAFRPDGQVIASASRDGTVRLWDAATGGPLTDLLNQPVDPLTAHKGAVRTVAYNPTPNPYGPGTWMLASGSNDKSVILWDTDRRRGVLADPLPTLSAEAAVGLDDQELFDRRSVETLAAHPEQQVVVWASLAGDVTRLDFADPEAPEATLLPGQNDRVRTIVYRSDGDVFATGGADCTVRLWDDATSRPATGVLAGGHTQEITGVAFAPGTGQVITSGVDARIVLWDLETGTPEVLAGEPIAGAASCGDDPPRLQALGVGFADDDRLLMAVLNDGTYLVWEWDGGIVGEPTVVRDYVVPGRSGSLGVTVGSDGVQIWNLPDDWTPLLDPGEPAATFAAAEPQGLVILESERVVTGNFDGTLQLWDLEAQKPIGPPVPTGQEVRGIAKVAGREAIVVFGDNGNFAVWDMSVEAWADEVCPLVGRGLSEADWDVLAPGQPYEQTCPTG